MSEIVVLNKVFANTYVLYNKVQQAHWKLQSPDFITLHKFFEEQYKTLSEYIDSIAEHIVQSNLPLDARLSHIAQQSILPDTISNFLDSGIVLKELIHDYTAISSIIKDNMPYVANLTLADDLIKMLKFYNTSIWMMKSSL